MTPQQAKNIKIGVGVVVAGVVLYLIFGDKNDNSGSSTDPTGNNSSNAGNPTGNVFNANNVVESLYEAMRELGTDEDTIINTLRYVTASQFDVVFQKFGKRQYNKTLGNQYNFNPFSQLPYVDLKGWLQNELSIEQYNNLKRKYPTKL